MRITCQALHKSYGPQQVLDGIDWEVPPGAIYGLLGPSGAGKTTLLRLLAGLEQPDSGAIAITDDAGSPIDWPRVGMVFQNLGLWPHLTAEQHLYCVLDRGSRSEKTAAARQLLCEVQMPAGVWSHRPEQLSGGEAQRLAIARALAIEPHLLLLDEPLAQIDTVLRQDLLAVLTALVKARSITAIYVTHSWLETQTLAEHVAVLADGRLVQSGSYDAVYESPTNALVARLTGPVVHLPRRYGVELVKPIVSEDQILLRPQQVRLVDSTDDNRWTVTHCRLSGVGWEVTLRAADEEIQVPSSRPYQPGSTTGLRVMTRPASLSD